MRTGFIWLATFLAFPLAGWPLLSHRAYRRLGLTSRFVLSGAVGCVTVTTVMTVSTVLGIRWYPPLILLSAALVSGAARLLVGDSQDRLRVAEQGRLQWAEGVALGVIFVSVSAATLAASSAAVTSADLFLFWGPKAMAFARARGIDSAYLGDPVLRYQHFSYPPLVPNAYAFATLVAGRFTWMSAVMTFPLLLASLVLALPGVLGSWCSRRSAFVATACMGASLALIGQEYLVGGNADFSLLLFEVLAVALLSGTQPVDRASAFLAGILLAGASAAKVEGLPFAICAGLLFVAFGRRGGSGRLAASALVLGPSVFVTALWFGFEKARLGFFGYETYGPFLAADWKSLGLVLWKTAAALADAGRGFPWIVPVAAIAVAFRLRREALVAFGTAMTLAAFFVFTYLHGGGDPTLWIIWSAGRIFAVISPMLVISSLHGREKTFTSDTPSI